MITLKDIFSDLTHGELAHLVVGGFNPNDLESEPDEKSYAQLISWLNLGLKAIYSEFLLASEEIEIQLYEAIGTYTLSYDFAVTNTGGAEPTKYIVDSVATPFTDNVLKIENIYDEEGNPLPLNDDASVDTNGDPNSLYTPTYRDIQVPWPNSYNTIAVQFRASHAPLSYTYGNDPADTEILIPHSLHQALLWYVGSRAHASLSGAEAQEGNDYYRKYQAEILRVKNAGTYIQNEPSNSRFSDNGWV